MGVGTEEFVDIQDGLCSSASQFCCTSSIHPGSHCASASQFCCTSRAAPSEITLCQCFTILLYIQHSSIRDHTVLHNSVVHLELLHQRSHQHFTIMLHIQNCSIRDHTANASQFCFTSRTALSCLLVRDILLCQCFTCCHILLIVIFLFCVHKSHAVYA